MNNRIDTAFDKGNPLLNVYFTAGFPEIGDTLRVARQLEHAGADMIEIGMPYSDPLADGPTIQSSSNRALTNGMTMETLFGQLTALRSTVRIPVILMGYLNPVLQFGIEKFVRKCKETGVDGVILPDLPMRDYLAEYKKLFDEHGIFNIFLISPQTSAARIREIDESTKGFIYVVSSFSITGAKSSISSSQIDYFNRIRKMKLKSKLLIGFGISDRETFSKACAHADGAIIGSAFIRHLENDSSDDGIIGFIRKIKN